MFSGAARCRARIPPVRRPATAAPSASHGATSAEHDPAVDRAVVQLEAQEPREVTTALAYRPPAPVIDTSSGGSG